MSSLQNKRALVVGGANGIGREIAKRLAAEGAEVTAVDLDGGALASLAAEHPAIATSTLDMTRPGAVADCLGSLSGDRRLDVVVMSAAIHGGCPLEAASDEFIDRLVEVNLVGHVKFLRDVLPHLADGARIVGISSNSAEVGIPMEGLYAGTKAALERVYEALSIELAHRGIRPLIVQTGNVNTGFNETNNPFRPEGEGYVAGTWRTVMDRIDSRNGIDPREVAGAVARLIAAPRPAFRTLVGQNALKTYWARRLLGTDLSLRLVTRVLGIRPPA